MIENIESRLWEVFENPEERERAITSLKNAKRVNNLKNDTVLMLLWYAKAVDGTLIRKNPELLRDNYAMSTWHHYCAQNTLRSGLPLNSSVGLNKYSTTIFMGKEAIVPHTSLR